tara:strand:+ start:4974 stop:8600 length:3627 start_codon:yes stop_codon:yes gene_type:complete
MLITKSIERIAGATVEISEITRRVLHLNWIMQTRPDVEDFDAAEQQIKERNWEADVELQENELSGILDSELADNQKQLSGLLFNFIHENDLDEDAEFKILKMKIKNSSSEKWLLHYQIQTALKVAEKSNCKWFGKMMEFGNLAKRLKERAEKGDKEIEKTEEPIAPQTFSLRILSKAQLLILIKLFIRTTYKDNFEEYPPELETEIWQGGGIQEFKKRRKDLAKRIKGQRAKYVRDSLQWNKAMNIVLHSRLVAIRGFGGYGKTTLVREIVYDLILRESKWNFSHYYLYSFKTDKQGDLGPDGEKQKPDTGMEQQENKFESVIDELYLKIKMKVPRELTFDQKKRSVIKHLSEESCLLVLDNYEDIDAVKGMEEEKKLFEEFFEELKHEIRRERQNTCIIITSRSSELASNVEFIELDLGKDAAISNATARDILKSYLRKLFVEDGETEEKLQHALTSINNQWDDIVLGKNIPEGIKHTRNEIEEIVRYPIVTNHLAYVMYSKGISFSEAIEEFSEALKRDSNDVADAADKTINYVVSRSHNLLFNSDEQEILKQLVHEIGSKSHPIGTWHRAIAELNSEDSGIMEKLLKTGFILPESQSMLDEYKFPPLVYSFLVKTYPLEESVEQKQNEPWWILNSLFDDSKRTKEAVMQLLDDDYSQLTEFGTANAINNMIHDFDKLTPEHCKAWLKLNEYAETTDRMSVTNLETKTAAVKMMLKYQDIVPDLYLNTMNSLILQIGYGISDDKQCKFLIDWCKENGKAKQFKFEGEYDTGDYIIIQGMKGSNIAQIPGRITIRKDSNIATFEVIDGQMWEVKHHALLILEQSRPDVFRVKLILHAKDEKETIVPLNPADEAKEIFDVIENKNLIGPRMDSGLHYLQHLNHYLNERITLERLEQVLRDDERYEVVNNTGVDKLWLARKKPDVGNWIDITNSLGIPQNPLTYALAIRMTAIKAKSNAFVEVHLNNDFNDKIREKILDLDIEPANVFAGLRPEIKRLFNYILLKSDSDSKGYLAYRSTITINKFEKKIIDTLGTEMINALGTMAKKDKALKNYKNMKIDLFQAIERSMKDERLLHMAEIYDAELNKKPEEIDEEEPEELEEETEEVEELTSEDLAILSSIVECLRDSADKGITVTEALEVMKNELKYGKNKCNLIVKHLGERKDTFDLEDVKIAIQKTLKDEKSVKKLSLSTTISSESDFENIWNEMI